MSDIAASADDIGAGTRIHNPPSSTVATTFVDLYRRQYESMVRLAYVLVDTQGEAEEVVQDAFAALLPRFVRVDHPEAYLRRCVLNGAREVLRRRRVARRQPAAAPEDAALSYNHV